MRHRPLIVIIGCLLALSCSGFAQEASNANSPCPTLPCIVASVSLINQPQSVYQVPIYTPPTTGLFRISYYEEVVGGFGMWTFTWNWTDDLKRESYGPFLLNPETYFNVGVPGMRVLAGTPITYTVTGHGIYNLFAIVEQLQ
jgi:hypothetical protein